MPKLLSFSAIQAVTFRILVNFHVFCFFIRKVCVSESKKNKQTKNKKQNREVTRMMKAVEAILSEELIMLPVTVTYL